MAGTLTLNEIERSSSPTPPESSVYFDIDDKDSELSTRPNSKVSRTSILTDPIFQSPITQQFESPRSRNPAVGASLESEFTICSTTTPTRPTLRFKVSPQSASPDPNSDIWSSSGFSEVDPVLYSPITERSRSSSIASLHQPSVRAKNGAKAPTSQHPCLQCRLADLSCSFSVERRPKHQNSRISLSTTVCLRCAQNGECFCIRQIVVEKASKELYLLSRRGGSEKVDYTYHADGVNKGVVMERAEELLEARREITRFALPKEGLWRRKFLKPVWGAWLRNDESVVEVVRQG